MQSTYDLSSDERTLHADLKAAEIAAIWETELAFGEDLSGVSAPDLGASVSIWQRGTEVLSLSKGFQDRAKTIPWTDATRVLFWSATKGLAAGTLLAVLDRASIPLEDRVARYWPEFAQNGKGDITIAQVLSHQAGLSGLLDSNISLFDHAGVCRALAAQAPFWTPGSQHGYHARTLGFLLDEIVRRLTSKTLGEMWREMFGDPLDLDLWIGLPEALLDQVAPVFPAHHPGGLPDDAFWRAMADPRSLTRLAFSTPAGLPSVASMNTPAARQLSLPALNGIGNARSLGKWYALLANRGEMDGKTFFSEKALSWMSTVLTSGPDLVTLEHTAFSAGFMMDPLDSHGRKIRRLFGPNRSAFGHPGAGGSHAFADPESGLAFAYLMNQMELGLFPNRKSLRLVDALYR